MPSPFPYFNWPGDLPQNDHAETYIRFFEQHGYQLADGPFVEPGFTKIAIYVEDDKFRHVARQLRNGQWSSKIGSKEDVIHELTALESHGPFGYGAASIFMKKAQ